jgi:uncharacterized protein YbaR (Trm112 family)
MVLRPRGRGRVDRRRHPSRSPSPPAAVNAVRDADVVVYLADATRGLPVPLAEAAGLRRAARAVLLTLNKADLLDGDARVRRSPRPRRTRVRQRGDGRGVDALARRRRRAAPGQPVPLPRRRDQHAVDAVLRRRARARDRPRAARRRGAVQHRVRDRRVPRGATPVYIRAVLYVERESQKGIVIGARGARLREIGRVARGKIETLVGGRSTSTCGSRSSRTGAATRARFAGSATPRNPGPSREPVAAAAGGARLPEVQGRPRVPRARSALVCHRCALRYPVRDDIPVMLIDEAATALAAAAAVT